MIRQPLGARLRALRTARGLTQSALGERLGMIKSAISKVETGEREPPVALIDAWATACGRILTIEFAAPSGPVDLASAVPYPTTTGVTMPSFNLTPKTALEAAAEKLRRQVQICRDIDAEMKATEATMTILRERANAAEKDAWEARDALLIVADGGALLADGDAPTPEPT